MTVVFPEAVKQQGNTSVVFVQTLANPASPGLAAGINAASSVNVSCFLYTGGQITQTQNRGAAPRRLCTVEELQQFGSRTTEVTDIQYVYDPQADDTDPANEAYSALLDGTEWFMVQRKGLSATTVPYAAGQRVSVTRVRLSAQNEGVTGDGEFDEYSITQGVIALSPPVQGVVAA